MASKKRRVRPGPSVPLPDLPVLPKAPTKLKKLVNFEFDTAGEGISAAATELQDIVMKYWWSAPLGDRLETLTMQVPGPGGGNPMWTVKVIYKETYDTLVSLLCTWFSMDEAELKECGVIS